MGSLLSKIPEVSKSTSCVIISLVSGSLFYFADHLSESTTKAIHLGSFATWFGTQFWVTFVAGIVMFNTLPRKTFGLVQSKLFPKYFLAGVGLSSISLATYLGKYPVLTGTSKTEGMLLASTLASNILSFLVVEPIVTAQMFRCHKYETEHGEKGQEIGIPMSEALKDDEVYVNLRKKFFKLHGISSLLNMSSLGTSIAYLWFLQKKINF